jgi:hypothetical protein
MKRYLLIIFAICFQFCVSCFASGFELESLNRMSGKDRWSKLGQYLVSINHFGIPPSDEVKFEVDNILLSLGYSPKNKIIKKGVWSIDKEAGSIYIKRAYIGTSEFKEQKYNSFKIECGKSHNLHYCQIILYVGKEFKEPKNLDEKFESNNYLQLSVINMGKLK